MGLIGLLSDQTERNLNQITTSVAPVIDYAGTPAVPVSRLGGCSGSLGDDNGWIASKFRQHDPSLFYIKKRSLAIGNWKVKIRSWDMDPVKP